MSHTLRIVLVCGVVGMVAPQRRRWVVLSGLAQWSVTLALLGFAGVAVLGRWRRLHRQRIDSAAADAEVPVLGELVALGLAAGMNFSEALRRAGEELTTDLSSEVDSVVRGMRRAGTHAGLETAAGRGRRLYVLAGRAMLTGAPMLDAVEMFVDEARSEERARRQAAVRRLPVTMVFPLALLILPGFVIVVLAPALIGSLQQFTS